MPRPPRLPPAHCSMGEVVSPARSPERSCQGAPCKCPGRSYLGGLVSCPQFQLPVNNRLNPVPIRGMNLMNGRSAQ